MSPASSTSMNKARVVVVDDEKPGRERLRRLLSRDDRVELIGCCEGGEAALDLTMASFEASTPVHIMFLDVQMPEFDGFAVVDLLTRNTRASSLPEIIFVTAHDEYAIRAFEAHATDYLLKPFSDERFQAALDRALRRVRDGHAQTMMSEMRALLAAGSERPQPIAAADAKPAIDRIVVRGSDRVRLLLVEQISWIEADGMYVKPHTRDHRVLIHRALLGSLDGALDERRFIRIHRSAIVNIDLVNELRQSAHGDYVAVLRDGTEIRVGRRFRVRLQARLGQQI